MSLGRRVQRRAERAFEKIKTESAYTEGPDGQRIRVLGSSLSEALIGLRAMDVPPAPPGAGDTDRDDIDPVAYRVAKNARKRARRARGR